MVKGSVITEEMRKAMGTYRYPDCPPEVVTIWGILRYIAATDDPNPLWRDEEYARKTRWGGIIAPPTFVEVFNLNNREMREVSGEQREQALPFKTPFERFYMGGEEFEFLVPIRPGDAISSKAVLGDIYEKQSNSGAGRLLFIQTNKEYHNQRRELVARTKWYSVHVELPPPAALASRPAVPERKVKPATISPRQVYFEDVNVGMALPPMEKQVTITTICKWAGATGDVGRVHFDYEYMKSVYGVPSVAAHGPLNGVYLAQLITNWIGSVGILKKHSTQYRGNTLPRDIITFQGKVARKWTEKGENFVECETSAENQHGMVVSLGKSTVTLPSKG